jgi:hypothetical protein
LSNWWWRKTLTHLAPFSNLLSEPIKPETSTQEKSQTTLGGVFLEEFSG